MSCWHCVLVRRVASLAGRFNRKSHRLETRPFADNDSSSMDIRVTRHHLVTLCFACRMHLLLRSFVIIHLEWGNSADEHA